MVSQVLPHCQCCHEVPNQGLYDGIRIQGVLFCSNCCQRVMTSAPDSILYHQFLKGLRKALFP